MQCCEESILFVFAVLDNKGKRLHGFGTIVRFFGGAIFGDVRVGRGYGCANVLGPRDVVVQEGLFSCCLGARRSLCWWRHSDLRLNLLGIAAGVKGSGSVGDLGSLSGGGGSAAN